MYHQSITCFLTPTENGRYPSPSVTIWDSFAQILKTD
jgi:hypothetical protein